MPVGRPTRANYAGTAVPRPIERAVRLPRGHGAGGRARGEVQHPSVGQGDRRRPIGGDRVGERTRQAGPAHVEAQRGDVRESALEPGDRRPAGHGHVPPVLHVGHRVGARAGDVGRGRHRGAAARGREVGVGVAVGAGPDAAHPVRDVVPDPVLRGVEEGRSSGT